MNIAEIYSEFCEYIEKRYNSINTQRAYIQDVSHFLDELDEVNKFDEDHINLYIFKMYKKGLTGRTIRRKLSSFSLFLNFIKQKRLIEKNPIELMEKPKIDKFLPKFLDVDDIEHLLNKIDDKRDRALLELIYSSSLRANEAISLNIEDVDLEHLRIRVTRKGAKVVYVPITKRAKRYLEYYIGERNRGALFLNRYSKRLSTRSLQYIVKKYSLKHIFKDISPHTLRHSKATHLLNSGMDIRLLQKFLGHSSIKATQIYTHLNFRELAKTYDKTHPLARQDSEE